MSTLRFTPHVIRLLLLAALLSLPALALAQSGGGYDLTWNTIDSGGCTFSSGGSYSLGGTIGQADAGISRGGAFALGGGFWGGGEAIGYGIYLPLVVKATP